MFANCLQGMLSSPARAGDLKKAGRVAGRQAAAKETPDSGFTFRRLPPNRDEVLGGGRISDPARSRARLREIGARIVSLVIGPGEWPQEAGLVYGMNRAR